MSIPNPNPNIADGVKCDNKTYSSNKIESLISTATELPIPEAGDAGKVLAVNSDEYGYELEALADVATSGAYSDLSGTPTLATVATSGAYSDLSGTPTLATVATSGSYEDLIDTPAILKTLDITVGDLTVTVPAGTMRDAFYNTDVSASLPEGATLKAVSVRYVTNACGITKQYCNDGTHISVGVCNPTNSDISVTSVDVTLYYI